MRLANVVGKLIGMAIDLESAINVVWGGGGDQTDGRYSRRAVVVQRIIRMRPVVGAAAGRTAHLQVAVVTGAPAFSFVALDRRLQFISRT